MIRNIPLIRAIILLTTTLANSLFSEISLENAFYQLKFSEENAAFTVKDKRNGFIWEAYDSNLCALDVLKTEKKNSTQLVTHTLRGSERYTITLKLSDEWIDINIGAPNLKQHMREPLVYPAPFKMNPKQGQLVIPSHNGLVVPMNQPIFKGQDFLNWGGHAPERNAHRGVFMPWMGMTDLQKGYLLLSVTAADGGYRMVTMPAPRSGYSTAGETFTALSYPSFETLGLERKLRLKFVTEGGYVSLCKAYRKYCQDTGRFRTLTDKIKDNPQHEKLLGAPNIWLWDNARNGEFVDKLKAEGIDKAWLGYVVNNGPNSREFITTQIDKDIPQYEHPNYNPPSKDTIEAALRNDYLWAPYDGIEALQDPKNLGWVRAYCPRHWPQEKGAIQYKNLFEIGFGSYGYRLCPEFYPEIAKERVDTEPRIFKFNSWFYDVTSTRPMHECWNPKHRISREQDLAKRMEMYQYAYENANLVVGSEDGADWGVKYCSYFQGNMTFQFFFGKKAWSKNMKDPYAHGIWDDPHRPSRMLRDNKPTATYLEFGLGHNIRVPLMELALGDCAVWTFRWNDHNYKSSATWKKKDLFCMLYGEPSIWNLTDDLFEKNKKGLLESYRNVDKWSGKVKRYELTDHRYLTSDRSVQQSTWSSGDYIIVNFSESSSYEHNGTTLKPMSFYKGIRL